MFDGVECSGFTECCGDIAAETMAAVCSSVSEQSGLSDWEVAGVVIGVLIACLLLASLACYCSNQQALRDQFKRAQATNPYTQSIVQEEADDRNGKAPRE